MTEISGIDFQAVQLQANGAKKVQASGEFGNIFGDDLIGGAEDTFGDNDAVKSQLKTQARELVAMAKRMSAESEKGSTLKKTIQNKMKALKEAAEAAEINLNEIFSEIAENMSRTDMKKVSKTLGIKLSKKTAEQKTASKTATSAQPQNPFSSMTSKQNPLFAGFNNVEANAGVSANRSYPTSYANTPNVKLDQAFLDKVKQISKDINCDYEDLLAVMNSESGLNSKAVNPKGGATGLIQFMPATAKSLGTTTEELKNMTPHQQLEYVEKYLKNAKASAGFSADKQLSGGDLYSLVFMPGKAKGEVLATAGTKAYSWNKGLDKDGDNQITKADLSRFVASKRVDESKVFA